MSQVSAVIIVVCWCQQPWLTTGNKEVTGGAGAVYLSVNPNVKTAVFSSKAGEPGFLRTDLVPGRAT